MINKERVKQTFLDMVSINSVSLNERKVADYLLNKLTMLSFSVEEDDCAGKINGNAGNIIAFRKGNCQNSETILLCAHMDTVADTTNLKVVIDGDIIKSDGTTILGADDKGGIAAILEGVESILESGNPVPDIQLFFDVCEETGLYGARYLDFNKIKAKYGYIFDTEKPAAGITVSAPYHEDIIVEITGIAAHAGMAPEKGVSAILAASNAISKMKLGRLDFETTANVGVIEGGKARNIVPDKVSIKAEARSRDAAKLDIQVEHMVNLFTTEAEAIGATASIKRDRQYEGFRWGENDPIVKLAIKALDNIGVSPVLNDGGGGSDANVFNSQGIPSVVIGVGYEGAHSNNEQLSLDELVIASRFAESLMQICAE